MSISRISLLLGLVFIVIGCTLPASVAAGTLKLRHRISLLVDGQQQPLRLPEGVFPAGKSELIAADTGNHRLVRYRAAKEFEYEAVAVVKIPQIHYPTKIEIHPRGDIFVLDRDAFRVVRLGPDGNFRGFFSLKGRPSAVIKSFTMDRSGNLYLLEFPGGRVQVLGSQGELLREIAYPEKGILADLAVDPNGRVLAVDGTTGIVYGAGPRAGVLAPISSPLKPYARFPSRISSDDRGRIFLSDRNGCRIVVLGQDGSFLANRSARGWKEGLLQYPAQISIEGNTLFIADTRNHRIQVFTISE